MRNTSFNVFCLTTLLFTGCGQSSTNALDAKIQDLPPEGQLVGTLGEAIKEIQSNKFRSACDKNLDSAKKTLVAKVIEQEKHLAQTPPSGTDTRPTIPFAHSFLLNYPKGTVDPSRIPADGWEHYRYGWNEVYNFYVNNLGHITPRMWAAINSEVRSLVLEDQKRVVYRANYDFSHEDIEELPAIKKVVDDCATDTHCLTPSFPAQLSESTLTIQLYADYMKVIHAAPTNAEKRDLVKLFSKRLAADGKRFMNTFNSELKLKQDSIGDHLSIELDATHFTSEDQKLIKSTIESVWKTERKDITVDFLSKAFNSKLFEVLFHMNRPGERDYVDSVDKTINLFPQSYKREISHEFGHVMGLTDHYYVKWDESKCEYDQQSNPADLMSDSESGDPLEADWKALIDHLSTPQS